MGHNPQIKPPKNRGGKAAKQYSFFKRICNCHTDVAESGIQTRTGQPKSLPASRTSTGRSHFAPGTHRPL
jgi:hypothetical protein